MKTSFNIRDDIHDMLKSLAEGGHRSLTKEVEFLIMEAYEKKGEMDEQKEG